MTYEFKEVPYPGEYAFAKYLRRKGAIENYRKQGESTVWYDRADIAIAICTYDNAKSCVVKCFIPKEESLS